MAEELVDARDSGLWITASADANGKGHRMKIPAAHVEPVLDAVRSAAAARADYALKAAVLMWNEQPANVPGLLDLHTAQPILTLAEGAVEALRVLVELAGEVVNDEPE